MEELESKVENGILILKKKFKPVLIGMLLFIPGLIILYLARESINDSLLNYIPILVMIYFIGYSILELVKIRNGNSLLELNSTDGKIYFEAKNYGNLEDIVNVLFEEEIDYDSDGDTINYSIRFEFLDNRSLVIYRSQNKKEQRGISWLISDFLGKRCLELNDEKRIIRKEKRRYKRLVADFEEKFKEKSREELVLILANKDKMANYTIEATNNLLNKKQNST